MLAVEYVFVFVVGVVAGAFLGIFVSTQMLSFLEVDEEGQRIEPPFILETQWLLVTIGVVAVVAVFLFALWATSRLVARRADTAALRTE
jgi:hypothetical protein